MRHRAPPGGTPRAFDDVAAAIERLAALLTAGATQQSAWRYLIETAPDDSGRRIAAEAARLAATGAPLGPAFRAADGSAAEAWHGVGALLALADRLGAPAASAMRRAATGVRSAAELHRTVLTSVAGPAASARITLLLPPGTAALGWAFGFDVPGVLLGTPLGAAAALLAATLLALARLWSRRLISAASTVRWQAGLEIELVALAVRAGMPTSSARLAARAAASEAGLALDDHAALDAVIDFADRAGVPVAALLDGEADRLRAAVLADAATTATVLAVRLLLPLGALVLPAFLLLGALPVGLAILSSTALPR